MWKCDTDIVICLGQNNILNFIYYPFCIPLCRCSTFSATNRFLNAARIRQDEDVLLQIDGGGDLIAKDIVYHRSCSQAYISQRNINAVRRTELESETHTHYEDAFSKLTYDLKNAIKTTPEVPYRLSSLCSQYEELLRNEGMAVSKYNPSRLKARLVLKFENALVFHRPSRRTESEFVFAADAPIRPMLEYCAKNAKDATATSWVPTDASNDSSDDEFVVPPVEDAQLSAANTAMIVSAFLG